MKPLTNLPQVCGTCFHLQVHGNVEEEAVDFVPDSLSSFFRLCNFVSFLLVMRTTTVKSSANCNFAWVSGQTTFLSSVCTVVGRVYSPEGFLVLITVGWDRQLYTLSSCYLTGSPARC